VGSLAWHAKINQLFLGSSGGQVHCLYDPKMSEHGIIRAVGKVPKKVRFRLVLPAALPRRAGKVCCGALGSQGRCCLSHPTRLAQEREAGGLLERCACAAQPRGARRTCTRAGAAGGGAGGLSGAVPLALPASTRRALHASAMCLGRGAACAVGMACATASLPSVGIVPLLAVACAFVCVHCACSGLGFSVFPPRAQADITNVGIGSVGHIYTPHALPAFRDDGCETKARAKRKERADPIKSKKPGLSVCGVP